MSLPRTRPPFRAEQVGSLIRPKALIEARHAFRAGRMSAATLRAIEDGAIREAVAMQERAGLQLVTDGEMRRFTFRDLFFESVSGFSAERIESSFIFTEFSGERHPGMPIPVVVGKLERAKAMTADEFRFTKTLTKRTVKTTLPSPGINHVYSGDKSLKGSPYRDRRSYLADVAAIYRQEIADLAALGCTYLQLDETPSAYLCDPRNQAMVRARGEDPDELIDDYIAAINDAIRGRPAAMAVCVHLCRGNSGHGLASGGYEPIAERVFAGLEVDGFLLEYDTERAGDFAPLRHLPKNKAAALGLVSTKLPQLEAADAIKRRIEEASRHASLDQLCLGPQCGFASNFDMERMSIAEEEAKLALIVRVADDIWG